jgi:hypothetical protein
MTSALNHRSASYRIATTLQSERTRVPTTNAVDEPGRVAPCKAAYSLDEGAVQNDTEEINKISFFMLFRYTTCIDKLWLVVGTIAALATVRVLLSVWGCPPLKPNHHRQLMVPSHGSRIAPSTFPFQLRILPA